MVCRANEAKLVYWALVVEQKAEPYREYEGWTFAALMDDETGITGDDGKKWFPRPADPGQSFLLGTISALVRPADTKAHSF